MWIKTIDGIILDTKFVVGFVHCKHDDKTYAVLHDGSKNVVHCGDVTDKIVDGINRDTKYMEV